MSDDMTQVTSHSRPVCHLVNLQATFLGCCLFWVTLHHDQCHFVLQNEKAGPFSLPLVDLVLKQDKDDPFQIAFACICTETQKNYGIVNAPLDAFVLKQGGRLCYQLAFASWCRQIQVKWYMRSMSICFELHLVSHAGFAHLRPTWPPPATSTTALTTSSGKRQRFSTLPPYSSLR